VRGDKAVRQAAQDGAQVEAGVEAELPLGEVALRVLDALEGVVNAGVCR
jgi:hypothetical protein